MNTPSTRREFLAGVGQGMLVASIGYEVAMGLGLSPAAAAEEAPKALAFGNLEPLVCLMQETPADHLLPELAARLSSGTPLRDLLRAGVLANVRSFGGEDYIGFHTMMAMSPAWHMSGELPAESQALPVFKVLYRNTANIQSQGGRKHEVLHPVEPAPLPANTVAGEAIRDAIRRRDLKAAEAMLATVAASSPEEAFNAVLYPVHDQDEVHRVVMPYRAWDLLSLVGMEHAHTMLRQSLHYCMENYSGNHESPKDLLPKVMEEHKLLDRTPGTRKMGDAWVDKFCHTLFESTPEQAAHATGAAIAEGIAPADISEAIMLAANQLILRDAGRTPAMEVPGKPVGSVHGDSIGVHACDSANAWRHMAQITNPRNCFASLIIGAHQVAKDRIERGGDFQHWHPLPVQYHIDQIKTKDATALLRDADNAIRGNQQAHAAALIHRYGELGHDPRAACDLMLRFAISEDGALHAEKFYRTCTDEFTTARPAFRWRYLTALARVTASEYGRPAPGMAQAHELLKVRAA